MKIAIMAPLVTAIREPQQGGSQAFVSDLARGLVGRGHDVHVYAASGSQIPGVTVIDTGVDPLSLAGTLYRPFRPAAAGPTGAESAAAESAFANAYLSMRQTRYDVIHNHAFDAPAVRLATALPAPVVHTLHLPPDEAVAAALADAARSRRRPRMAAVSAFQASAWRRTVPIDVILPPYVPTSDIPWSAATGNGAVFAGRLSPEKGAAEAIDIARAAGVPVDVYGDSYDADYARDQIAPRAASPGEGRPGWACLGSTARSGAPDVAVGGHGARRRGPLSRQMGRTLRHGRGRGAGLRYPCRRIQARRA